MNNPKISVIVPVYKAERYLHKCVDSLLAQTFQDYEILLIDDGSPDRSGEICDEYAKKDSRIRVFHKENGGVSSARQCGLDNAQGEYTIHADPDDWVEPDMLEELYKKAKEDDADMVICDFYENRGDKQRYVKQQPDFLDHKVVLKNLFQQLHGSCWNKLVRRVCYNKYDVKFDLELSFCEDLYCNASLLRNPLKISYFHRAFYHYEQLVNINSIVQNYSKDTYLYDVGLLEKFRQLLKDTSVYDYANNSCSFLIVYRAFLAHIFTSNEFKEYCFRYRDFVFYRGGRILGWFMYMSCIGYYDAAYRMFTTLKNFKNRTLLK